MMTIVRTNRNCHTRYINSFSVDLSTHIMQSSLSHFIQMFKNLPHFNSGWEALDFTEDKYIHLICLMVDLLFMCI